MGQATIRVFADGRFLKEIERPVRHVGGHPAVKYKGVLHPIINGNEVHLSRMPDTVVPASPVTAMPPRLTATPTLRVPVKPTHNGTMSQLRVRAATPSSDDWDT